MENKNNQPPIKVYRSGPVKFAAWHNTVTRDGEEVKSYAFKLTRAYFDKNSGEWKTTNRFFLQDLPRVAMLATRIWSELGVQIYKPENQEHNNDNGPENGSNDHVNKEQP